MPSVSRWTAKKLLRLEVATYPRPVRVIGWYGFFFRKTKYALLEDKLGFRRSHAASAKAVTGLHRGDQFAFQHKTLHLSVTRGIQIDGRI
jgi:hypothetical protein